MKPEEAIAIIETEKSCIEKSTKGQCSINCGECKENVPIAYKMKSYDMAIEALKEVQLYHLIKDVTIGEIAEVLKEFSEIGTVEECRKAVEKQKAKKCDVTKDNFRIYYKCPTCSHCLRVEYNHGSWMGKKSKNCSKCGQAIQWNENLEEMEDE